MDAEVVRKHIPILMKEEEDSLAAQHKALMEHLNKNRATFSRLIASLVDIREQAIKMNTGDLPGPPLASGGSHPDS